MKFLKEELRKNNLKSFSFVLQVIRKQKL